MIQKKLNFDYYLAPNFVWERGIVLLVWVCDSVCGSVCGSVILWFCDQDNSKSYWPISIKFGRNLGYYKIKVSIDVDKNRIDRLQTSSNRNFQNAIS